MNELKTNPSLQRSGFPFGRGSLRGILIVGLLGYLPLSLPAAPRAGHGFLAPAGAAESVTQGLKVKPGGLLFGSTRHCKTPASVDYRRVLAATPEMRKVEEEGIDRSSARYQMLRSKAVRRIRKVVRVVAVELGHDCVVREDKIRSKPEDLILADLTEAVVERLEAQGLDD